MGLYIDRRLVSSLRFQIGSLATPNFSSLELPHFSRELQRYGRRSVMADKAAMTPSIKTSNLSKPEKVACPKCVASVMFCRSDKPHIDECGFESYSLKCRACGSMLVGIIDPADDALLLTVCS